MMHRYRNNSFTQRLKERCEISNREFNIQAIYFKRLRRRALFLERELKECTAKIERINNSLHNSDLQISEVMINIRKCEVIELKYRTREINLELDGKASAYFGEERKLDYLRQKYFTAENRMRR